MLVCLDEYCVTDTYRPQKSHYHQFDQRLYSTNNSGLLAQLTILSCNSKCFRSLGKLMTYFSSIE